MHRWWMDFGGSFEAVFRRIRRFILVVWAKNAPEKGPNDTRKAPPIYALHPPSPQKPGPFLTELRSPAKAGRKMRR